MKQSKQQNNSEKGHSLASQVWKVLLEVAKLERIFPIFCAAQPVIPDHGLPACFLLGVC